MKFSELVILLPCHSLEDFPTHYRGDEAAGLLAAWTALWHPALIHNAGHIAVWRRADVPPDVVEGRLIFVPTASMSLLPDHWIDESTAAGATVIAGLVDRAEWVAETLAKLGDDAVAIGDDAVADFYSLGFSWLTVELLTRQMRYMSNVDEHRLERESVAAAAAAASGDTDATRRALTNAFEGLVEARDRIYPVDSYLVDLTLVAASTLGEPLRLELAGDAPVNLLASGEVVEALAGQAPATLAVLELALNHGTASIASGEYAEIETPLFPPETALAELERGIAAVRDATGKTPAVYGRRRYGLAPRTPQILNRAALQGALHFTLDDGQFPTSGQSKTRWEGIDGTGIDALARPPLDGRRSETFLRLARTIGESMDRDHVATVTIAHWPGQACPHYEDLRRTARFAPVLGRFITLADYFRDTAHPGDQSRFAADKYRSPYLEQDAAAGRTDATSRFVAVHRDNLARQAVQALTTFADLLAGAAAATDVLDNGAGDAAVDRAAGRLASLATRADGPRGWLVVNPCSFPRLVTVELPTVKQPPADNDAIVAAQTSHGRMIAVVDVPGNGFARLGAASEATTATTAARPRKPAPPLATGYELVNEHMRVRVNPDTGAITSIRDFVQRNSRLSAQLAYRFPPPQPAHDVWRPRPTPPTYSVMAADRVEITAAGPALGEITVAGRLVDTQGKRLAGYRQVLRLPRRSRVLEIEVELDPDTRPSGDPWQSYYAMRWAWRTADDIVRGVQLCRLETSAHCIEAPYFVELAAGDRRTALLSGGLPYHVRADETVLDTLLAPPGEAARRFRLGVAIDEPHPWHAALGLIAPTPVVPDVAPLRTAAAATWLFHVDALNVLVNHWSTIVDDQGRCLGFRARLIETLGRSGRVGLRSFRGVRAAHQVDFAGGVLFELPTDGDTVRIELGRYDWVAVEVLWSAPSS